MPVEQISPDKDVNCGDMVRQAHYALSLSKGTAAAFTLSPEPWVSLCCANLPGNWALYAVPVCRLIALHSGFLQTVPRGSALAFG